MKLDPKKTDQFNMESNSVNIQILTEEMNSRLELINRELEDQEEILHLNYNSEKYNVLSLFSGCGGLDLGFELAGLVPVVGETIALEAFKNKDTFNKIRNNGIFNIFYANDFWREAHESYKLNFSNRVFTHLQDVQKIKKFPKSDIVLGGFPFPGFSEDGPRLIDNKKNALYLHFIRCLIQSQPKFFITENIKDIVNKKNNKILKQIIEDFKAVGYDLQFKLINARDYGVPQTRERVFIVGVRKDIKFTYEFPDATHGKGLLPYMTLEDSIGDLRENPGPYFIGPYSRIYLSRNRKRRWDQQSFTIQASAKRAPLHPDGPQMIKSGRDQYSLIEEEQNRRLSIREVARIQTFPDWFKFNENSISKSNHNSDLYKIYKQIGNAVPVILAKSIAQPIANWIYEQSNHKAIMLDDYDDKAE